MAQGWMAFTQHGSARAGLQASGGKLTLGQVDVRG